MCHRRHVPADLKYDLLRERVSGRLRWDPLLQVSWHFLSADSAQTQSCFSVQDTDESVFFAQTFFTVDVAESFLRLISSITPWTLLWKHIYTLICPEFLVHTCLWLFCATCSLYSEHWILWTAYCFLLNKSITFFNKRLERLKSLFRMRHTTRLNLKSLAV